MQVDVPARTCVRMCIDVCGCTGVCTVVTGVRVPGRTSLVAWSQTVSSVFTRVRGAGWTSHRLSPKTPHRSTVSVPAGVAGHEWTLSGRFPWVLGSARSLPCGTSTKGPASGRGCRESYDERGDGGRCPVLHIPPRVCLVCPLTFHLPSKM